MNQTNGFNGGINSLKGRVILFPEAKLDYSHSEIKKFIKLWEEGWPISEIAERFYITKVEAVLVVMHCDAEGWLEARKGGLLGTRKRTKKSERNSAIKK